MRGRPLGLCLAASAGLLAAAVAVPAALLPSVAAAATVTTWSAAGPIDHQAPLGTGEPVSAVSCPTAALCVGVGYGDIETTTDPAAVHHAPSGWQDVNVDGSYPTVVSDPTISAVSCATPTLCVAVDSNGNVLTSRAPTHGIAAWTIKSADRGVDLLGVSCPSTSLCVAFGRGPASRVTLTSTDPSSGAKARWVARTVSSFGMQGPSGISCPTTSLCVAAGTDDNGISTVWTSINPKSAGSATWTKLEVGSTVGSDFLALSCASSSACVAVGEHGQAASSGDASKGTTATWHDLTVAGDDMAGVSCTSSTLCDSVDLEGNVFTSKNAGGASPTWAEKPTVDLSGQTIACVGSTLCVVTGAGSKAVSTTDPSDAAAAIWKTTGYTAFSSINAISCPTASFCAAADSAGNISTSTDPGSKSATWTTTNVNPGLATNPGGSYLLEGIACPSSHLCVAVDDIGNVLTSIDPGSGSPTWTAAKVDNAGGFTAITCRSAALCVAVDFAGDAVVASNPTGGVGAWTTTNIDHGSLTHYQSVSCPSATECFAGSAGGAVTTVDLGAGGAVTTTSTADIDLGIHALNGISCPTTSLCVAADSSGNIVRSTKPAGAASGWKLVKVDVAGATKPSNELTGISCSSTKHCVAVDVLGNAVGTTDPAGTASAWRVVHTDPYSGLNAVSCPTASLCVAVDATGNETFGHTAAAPLRVATAALPAATAGARYDRKVSASGGTGPYHWKRASGSLPAGLKLSPSGTISGKPHSAGTSHFVLRVTDSAKTPASVNRAFTLAVHLAIGPASLHHGTAGASFHVRLVAKGGKGPYHWKRATGSLPAGLTLSASGTISGKPRTAGSSTFTVRVTDSAKPAHVGTKRYKLVVSK